MIIITFSQNYFQQKAKENFVFSSHHKSKGPKQAALSFSFWSIRQRRGRHKISQTPPPPFVSCQSIHTRDGGCMYYPHKYYAVNAGEVVALGRLLPPPSLPPIGFTLEHDLVVRTDVWERKRNKNSISSLFKSIRCFKTSLNLFVLYCTKENKCFYCLCMWRTNIIPRPFNLGLQEKKIFFLSLFLSAWAHVPLSPSLFEYVSFQKRNTCRTVLIDIFDLLYAHQSSYIQTQIRKVSLLLSKWKYQVHQ